jgi:hypothetical protein
MLQSSCHIRRLQGRYRPGFDRLESRIALAAGGGTDPTNLDPSAQNAAADVADPTQGQPLAVDLLDPAPGSILHASPSILTLQFNHPIFPDTLSNDVGIVQVDADGNPTGWYTVPDQSQLGLDETATRLTVEMDQTIPPGHYQVWIFGSTEITDITGDPLVSDGDNLILGAFDVAVAGVRLVDAIDLGTLGPAPIEVPGTLDFQSNPYAVSLYRVHVGPGHHWRLGAEVTAQRDGGTLDTALALFDSRGRPIAVDEAGRKDAPLDPFLFAGLQPGTYYLGVSGTGNLPGPLGGYDPSTGSAGSIPQTQAGGPYTLHVVADPVDSPPQLRSLSIDHADSHSASPTGLTLSFTRAVALGGDIGNLSPTLSQGIEVRDDQGRIWPVQASGYDEAEAQVSYLFKYPLPAGHYTIGLPQQGGLVDLAGLAPVAPGEPLGILGNFDVPTSEVLVDSHDLGAILPGDAIRGRSLEQALGPGESVTYRVVLTFPTLYEFEISAQDTAPSVRIEGESSSHAIEPTGTNDTQLGPGEYLIRMQNPWDVPIRARLDFRAAVIDPELLLANGVGQGPGLSLRLIAFPGAAVEPPSILPVTALAPDSSAPSSTQSESTVSSPVIATPMGPPPQPPESVAAQRDPGSKIDLPQVSTVAFRSEQSSSVTISFLGLETDLIGRPYIGGVRGTSSELNSSLSGEISLVRGVAQGRTPLTVGRAGMGLDAAWLAATDVILDIVVTQGNPVGAAVGSGGPRMTRLVDLLRPWAVSLRSATSAGAELAPRDPRTSEAPWTDAVSDKPRPSVIRSSSMLDRAAAVENVEATDETDSWVEYLSPAIAALSAAVVARACRRFARWWKRRDRRHAGGIVRSRDRSSTASEMASSDRVGTFIDETRLSPTRRPVPRAS